MFSSLWLILAEFERHWKVNAETFSNSVSESTENIKNDWLGIIC